LVTKNISYNTDIDFRMNYNDLKKMSCKFHAIVIFILPLSSNVYGSKKSRTRKGPNFKATLGQTGSLIYSLIYLSLYLEAKYSGANNDLKPTKRCDSQKYTARVYASQAHEKRAKERKPRRRVAYFRRCQGDIVFSLCRDGGYLNVTATFIGLRRESASQSKRARASERARVMRGGGGEGDARERGRARAGGASKQERERADNHAHERNEDVVFA
jgi:hypothetical protein